MLTFCIDQDMEATKFRGTERSLIVRGFVKQEDVSLEYWFGKGCHVIVPQAVSFLVYFLVYHI